MTKQFLRKRMRKWNKQDCMDQYGMYFYWKSHFDKVNNHVE